MVKSREYNFTYNYNCGPIRKIVCCSNFGVENVIKIY